MQSINYSGGVSNAFSSGFVGPTTFITNGFGTINERGAKWSLSLIDETNSKCYMIDAICRSITTNWCVTGRFW